MPKSHIRVTKNNEENDNKYIEHIIVDEGFNKNVSPHLHKKQFPKCHVICTSTKQCNSKKKTTVSS